MFRGFRRNPKIPIIQDNQTDGIGTWLSRNICAKKNYLFSNETTKFHVEWDQGRFLFFFFCKAPPRTSHSMEKKEQINISVTDKQQKTRSGLQKFSFFQMKRSSMEQKQSKNNTKLAKTEKLCWIQDEQGIFGMSNIYICKNLSEIQKKRRSSIVKQIKYRRIGEKERECVYVLLLRTICYQSLKKPPKKNPNNRWIFEEERANTIRQHTRRTEKEMWQMYAYEK